MRIVILVSELDFILTISFDECQTKSFYLKYLILYRQILFMNNQENTFKVYICIPKHFNSKIFIYA